MKIFYTSKRDIWRTWLAEHFEKENEIWFVFPMKESGDKALHYNDVARKRPDEFKKRMEIFIIFKFFDLKGLYF